MKDSIPLRVAAIALLIATSVSAPAFARAGHGSIGNGGRMPETMSPGAMSPPATSMPSAPASTSSMSFGAQYPSGSTSSAGFLSQAPTPKAPTGAVN